MEMSGASFSANGTGAKRHTNSREKINENRKDYDGKEYKKDRNEKM